MAATQPPPSKATIPADSSPTAAAPTSLWSREYWTDLFDQQRVQRLEQCKTLNSILDSCEAAHSHSKKHKKKQHDKKQSQGQQVPHLNDVGPGLRMLMYYDWRNKIEVHQKGCVPERHSVWTCRAVALGCGEHLRRMKECFDAEGIERILSQPATAYQDPASSSGGSDVAAQQLEKRQQSIPCWEFQQAMGECVMTQGRKLAEKKIRWDKEKEGVSS